MPPWLIQLLSQSNSRGYADSLSTLIGAQPTYQQAVMPGRQAANFTTDAQGRPVVTFNSRMQGKMLQQGGSGYDESSPRLPLINYVLGHEMGHAAASGAGGNQALADQLLDIRPDAQSSEQFADDFQQAAEFLRTGSTDLYKLPKRAQQVAGVLLQQDLYKNHPINSQRAFGSLVAKP